MQGLRNMWTCEIPIFEGGYRCSGGKPNLLFFQLFNFSTPPTRYPVVTDKNSLPFLYTRNFFFDFVISLSFTFLFFVTPSPSSLGQCPPSCPTSQNITTPVRTGRARWNSLIYQCARPARRMGNGRHCLRPPFIIALRREAKQMQKCKMQRSSEL